MQQAISFVQQALPVMLQMELQWYPCSKPYLLCNRLHVYLGNAEQLKFGFWITRLDCSNEGMQSASLRELLLEPGALLDQA